MLMNMNAIPQELELFLLPTVPKLELELELFRFLYLPTETISCGPQKHFSIFPKLVWIFTVGPEYQDQELYRIARACVLSTTRGPPPRTPEHNQAMSLLPNVNNLPRSEHDQQVLRFWGQTELDRFHRGNRVEIHSLTSRRGLALNGRTGRVVSKTRNADGRWRVRLAEATPSDKFRPTETDEYMLLKQGNLEPAVYGTVDDLMGWCDEDDEDDRPDVLELWREFCRRECEMPQMFLKYLKLSPPRGCFSYPAGEHFLPGLAAYLADPETHDALARTHFPGYALEDFDTNALQKLYEKFLLEERLVVKDADGAPGFSDEDEDRVQGELKTIGEEIYAGIRARQGGPGRGGRASLGSHMGLLKEYFRFYLNFTEPMALTSAEIAWDGVGDCHR